MKNLVYRLCEHRKLFVSKDKQEAFEEECKVRHIEPQHDQYGNYSLPNPISVTEAQLIADVWNCLGDFKHLIERKKLDAYDALSTLGLI